MIPDCEVKRIFLSDVKNCIENNGLTSSGDCDKVLQAILTKSHQRVIEVYALFSLSNNEFSEKIW